MKKNSQKQGFVMAGVLMLLLIGALVAGGLVVSARQTLSTVERWQSRDECLLAAQTAVERVKYNVYQGFSAYHGNTFSWTNITWLETHAGDYSTTGTLSSILGTNVTSPYYASAQIVAAVTPGTVFFATNDTRMIYVTNTVTATWQGTVRRIEETVRYTLNRSSVFDHAYFINNFGWFRGVNLVANGNLRSNFTMELNATNLVLNGISYAAGKSDIKKPFTSWNEATYASDPSNQFFRPFFYVDSSDPAATFAHGYDPDTVNTYEYQYPLEMPFIGNLGDYKFYAQEKGGTIKTGSTVIVDAVYGFDQIGPSGYSNAITRTGLTGISNAADRGCIVLVGTVANPIRIDGPVVVEGDVVIKGYFTGQGTIYAGRNIHIIDSIIATNPPLWSHAGSETAVSFSNRLQSNLQKDFLGLCAKGSIVIGNYLTASYTNVGGAIEKYLKPPFTRTNESAAADADIGYVSFTQNGTNYFDGNYTGFFGYQCGAIATNSVPRRYYESSLSDTNFSKLGAKDAVNRIDAVIYNNHLTCGKTSAGGMYNGGIICRDEALIPSGRVYMNWDSRIALDTDFKPYLPMSLSPAKTISWTELTP